MTKSPESTSTERDAGHDGGGWAGWWKSHRARIEILAIAGVAIGGIVCMAGTIIVLIFAGR